ESGGRVVRPVLELPPARRAGCRCGRTQARVVRTLGCGPIDPNMRVPPCWKQIQGEALGFPAPSAGTILAKIKAVNIRTLFVLFAAAAATMAAAQPAKILPYAFTQQDLPNGLRLIVVPTDLPNIVATYI